MGGEILDDLLGDLAGLEAGEEILIRLVGWLRPLGPDWGGEVDEKVFFLEQTLLARPGLLNELRIRLCAFMTGLRFLPLYSETGILPRRGFGAELSRRIHGRILPEPPTPFSAKDFFARLFDDPRDPFWVAAVPTGVWTRLHVLFVPDDSECEIGRHLRSEALYALEMLSIWLAAEEMEGEFLRIDPAIASRDSCLIAQEREINLFVQSARAALHGPLPFPAFDVRHAWVLLEQTDAQIQSFRQLSVRRGSSFELTYLLERMEQTLHRVRDLLFILATPDETAGRSRAVALFATLVAAQRKEQSVGHLLRQTRRLVAKSIVGNAAKTGEHYVTETRAEYRTMIWRGLGAGVVIAFMALIKIGLTGLGLSPGWTTVWVSLNYGLGFIVIHLLHGTVATKQPAMTAAYIATAIDDAGQGRANLDTVARVCIRVARSQFAAVAGNVGAALPTALVVAGAAAWLGDGPLVPALKGARMLHELTPVSGLALFHAAIAGVWLCLSGLIAGYFDNRAAYLNLAERIRRHPLRPRVFSDAAWDRVATYLGANYGALAGNFCFGLLLGVTGYVGHVTGLPLDIRHVAFAVANLGYAAGAEFPGLIGFMMYFVFALLVGGVNLAVSFGLTLNLALRARGVRLGSWRELGRAVWVRVRQAPRCLFLPPR